MDEFNTVISRKNSNSYKWDFPGIFFGKSGDVPFTVADSDYLSPSIIQEEMIKRVEHGMFGYTLASPNYFRVVADWMKRRYCPNAKEEWIVPISGTIFGIGVILELFTKEHDGVVIQTPVYHRFLQIIPFKKRTLLCNSLMVDHEKYQIDFIDLEEKFKNGAKVLLFCNPHNPVGRVYTKEEVEKVVMLCKKYQVLLISDEVHSDIVLSPHKFVSAGTFLEEYENIILCTAPGKTFNIAGLKISNLWIKNEKMRIQIIDHVKGNGVYGSNIFGFLACEIGYGTCEEWVKKQCLHIANNYATVKKYLSPYLEIAPLEGTYLVWLNFKSLGFTNQELIKRLSKYQILFQTGTDFSSDYDGYLRMNIACPISQLEFGLKRLVEFLMENKKI